MHISNGNSLALAWGDNNRIVLRIASVTGIHRCQAVFHGARHRLERDLIYGRLGRLLGLDGGRVLGGLLRRDGLGRDDDLLAVGQVGGGDGVLAAVVGGELRAGVGDGGNLLTVVRRNRKREVEGVGNVNGLGIRLGRDALLGAVLRAVLQRAAETSTLRVTVVSVSSAGACSDCAWSD